MENGLKFRSSRIDFGLMQKGPNLFTLFWQGSRGEPGTDGLPGIQGHRGLPGARLRNVCCLFICLFVGRFHFLLIFLFMFVYVCF